ENQVPERPVKQPCRNGARRVSIRAPAPVLTVAICFNAAVSHQSFYNGIISFTKVLGYRLVINIGQETVPETRLCIIRVARLVGFGVVHMVRNDINLLGDNTDGELLGKKSPKTISEFISAVRTIAMEPHRAVGAHDNHTINESAGDH